MFLSLGHIVERLHRRGEGGSRLISRLLRLVFAALIWVLHVRYAIRVGLAY